MKRKQLLTFSAAAVTLSAACAVGVYGQTLAGTTAAIGAGATLGAAGGAGLLTPSQYAAPATRALSGQQQGAAAESPRVAAPSQFSEDGFEAEATSEAGGEQSRTASAPPPLKWGTASGGELVQELTRPRVARTAPRPAPQQRRKRSAAAQQPRQQAANGTLKKPSSSGYLSWYLPEDRSRISSGVWKFVTTPNDQYYYRAWAPTMKLRNPARVIGFNTWQDAMIAGYRPDPITKPEPGAQLAHLASLTNGPMLSLYFEYVYAGQVTPATFEGNYRYVRYVADLVGSKSHTRHLVGETVDQVLGAAMGRNELPRYIGTPPPAATGGENELLDGEEFADEPLPDELD